MSPTISPSDHVNQLWARRREEKSAFDLLANSPEGTEEACEVANKDIRNVEVILECELTALGCIHAAGAVLLTEIEDNREDEAFDGFYRGLLRAIRPHLVGEIAEDADRALAKKSDAAA